MEHGHTAPARLLAPPRSAQAHRSPTQGGLGSQPTNAAALCELSSNHSGDCHAPTTAIGAHPPAGSGVGSRTATRAACQDLQYQGLRPGSLQEMSEPRAKVITEVSNHLILTLTLTQIWRYGHQCGHRDWARIAMILTLTLTL